VADLVCIPYLFWIIRLDYCDFAAGSYSVSDESVVLDNCRSLFDCRTDEVCHAQHLQWVGLVCFAGAIGCEQ